MIVELSVSLPVNSRMLVVKFWEESKVTVGFSTAVGGGRVGALISLLGKDKLYS